MEITHVKSWIHPRAKYLRCLLRSKIRVSLSLSLSHSLGKGRREPWERGCRNENLYISKEAKREMLLHQRANHADQKTEIQYASHDLSVYMKYI